MKERDFREIKDKLGGVSRRDLLKFFTVMAASMGLPLTMGEKFAEAVAAPKRPPVIWLSGQGCTGCTETLLRATHPKLDTLILSLISLDYNETLASAAGHQVEAAKHQSMKDNKGKYIMVVDGSVPIKDNGIYCKIAGKTMLEHVKEVGKDAAAVIAIGSCSSWGGIPSASPNPTGATALGEVLKGMKDVVNIPGCPPNPYNFLSTVIYFLTLGKLPALDKENRPMFAYGRLIHENCERRPHFDAGRFAKEFGDEGHSKGYCLFKLGCKGPETFANCPSILFGDTGSGTWPVGVGHPCFGCTEKGIGFTKGIHEQAAPKYVTPPLGYPDIAPEQGKGATVAGAALVAGVAGIAIGAGAMMAKNLGKKDDKESSD